jgi:FdhD protein
MKKKSNIFIEESVDLYVNGKKMITFMCTPENLKEMALGYLYSRGLIDSIEEFIGATPCNSGKRIFALVDKELKNELYSVKNIVMSGCGSGELPKESEFYKRKIKSGYRVGIENIKGTFVSMLESANLHQTTGGTHSAAIKDSLGRVIVREDIGRHNAVDKVIGAALLEGMDLSRSTVVITGRVSSDMVVKAAGAGVPVVASMRITSNMAIDIANKYKVNLIGRIGSSEPLIYNEVEGTYIER